MSIDDYINIKIRIKLESVASPQKHLKKSPDYNYAREGLEDAVDRHLFFHRI
jgi:hypothetical protein